MNIYGNTVGHPLPDPRSGLNMTGPINMNGQALNGLKVPTENDDAVNKSYVDNHINNKNNPHGVTAEQLTGTLSTNVLPIVPIVKGGTDASSSFAAIQNLFDVNVDGDTKVYPTKPGIYRTVGDDIFANLTAAHGVYGMLVIFKAVYTLHIYVDSDRRFFWGFTGEAGGEPPVWNQAVTEAQVTTMINNALGVIENGTY